MPIGMRRITSMFVTAGRSRLYGTALVRRPSKMINEGLVTHIVKENVNYVKAMVQWETYIAAFKSEGWKVVEVDAPVPDNLADSVFIEDILVMFGKQGGIITRPGTGERRPETNDLESLIGSHIPLRRLIPPALLDGGDVMKIDAMVYVGMGGRTNEEGIKQLQSLLGGDYRVIPVPMTKALHLKSACTALPDGSIIYWPPALDEEGLAALRRGESRLVEACEEPGAHVVNLSEGTVLMSASAVRTKKKLEKEHNLRVVTVPLSEFEKLEGCVTCLSVRVRDPSFQSNQ